MSWWDYILCMTGEQEGVPKMSVSHYFLIHFELTAVAPVCERGTLPAPYTKFDLFQCIHSLLTCHRERAEKENVHRPLLRWWRKQSAVHLHLGHWLLLPAVNCSHMVSVPLNHTQYFSVQWTAGNLEWETRRRRHRGVLQKCPCEGKLCIYTVYR